MSSNPAPSHEPIAMDDVVLLDPENVAPPTVSHDAHIAHVGSAHGRVIPLVGLYRPYIYDLGTDKITDNHLRIYADTADDAIGVLAGGHLPAVLADLADAVEALPSNPAEIVTPDQDTLILLGDDADPEVPELTEEQREQHAHYLEGMDRIDDLRVQVAGLIAGHADSVRCTAQAAINEEARLDGRWERLAEQERQHLVWAADASDEGLFPTGLPEEMPLFDEANEESGVAIRGVWSADVPLVCNRGNYFPWNEVLPPESTVEVIDEEGDVYIKPGEPNLVWLEIASPQNYLDSLDAAGVVDLSIRPVDHPLDFMRPFLREKRQRDRAQLQELAANAD